MNLFTRPAPSQPAPAPERVVVKLSARQPAPLVYSNVTAGEVREMAARLYLCYWTKLEPDDWDMINAVRHLREDTRLLVVVVDRIKDLYEEYEEFRAQAR